MTARNPSVLHRFSPGTALFVFILPFATPAQSKAFSVGEELQYRIRMGPMTVGHSSMSVKDRIIYDGVECLIFQTTASATPMISAFFPVNDRITSYWDPVRQRPLWMEKRLNEGNFHRNYDVRFDYRNRRAFWKEHRFAGNTKKAGELAKDAKWRDREGVTENVPVILQDMLSAIYYARLADAQGGPGDEFSMPVYDDLQVTTLKMVIRRRGKKK